MRESNNSIHNFPHSTIDMELEKIQKRINELKKKIDETPEILRKRHQDVGISQGQLDKLCAKEIAPLESEVGRLESLKQFKIQLATLKVSWALVLVTLTAAFGVPWWQGVKSEQDQIQAVYKNLVTNQDIFISNANNARKLPTSNNIANLPEFYIEGSINDSIRHKLQDTLGLVQYRFFLYYLQQTSLLNEEIKQIRDAFIVERNKSFIELNPTAKYLASMEYLTITEGKEAEIDTMLDYQKDTECLKYLFEYSFSYLTTDGRGKAPECSSATLDRIFNHFGYLEADTPLWLKPHYRRMLNDREPGLGNRLIEI